MSWSMSRTQQLYATLCSYEVMLRVTQGLAAPLWLPRVCSAVSHHFDELQPTSCRWSLRAVCTYLFVHHALRAAHLRQGSHFMKVYTVYFHSVMPYLHKGFLLTLGKLIFLIVKGEKEKGFFDMLALLIVMQWHLWRPKSIICINITEIKKKMI